MKSFVMFVTLAMLLLPLGCMGHDEADSHDKDVLAHGENIEILSRKIGSTELSDIVELWIRDKNTGKEDMLLRTMSDPTDYNYKALGNRFVPVSIDSIPAADEVVILPGEDRIIVSGVPDARNVFSYVIDLPERKAWEVPSTAGYVGQTPEECFLIFASYRYFREGGRFSFLKVFNDEGVMIDSLSMEPHGYLE